jgi:glyoxylase-like metal-dependent hydrolase (beta-lactamase superfamily II)
LGNSWFPDAIIVSHERCRELINTQGRAALEHAQKQSKELVDVSIVLPDVVFDRGGVSLRVGKRTLQLVFLPGHSPDGIGVLIEEDRVLFSGDIMMSIPYIVDGDFDIMIESLKKIPEFKLENLIQGHGEVVLRGEVQSKVENNIDYLNNLRGHVRKASRRREPEEYLMSIDVESCGKSRILLNGLAEELHTSNLLGLYQKWYG